MLEMFTLLFSALPCNAEFFCISYIPFLSHFDELNLAYILKRRHHLYLTPIEVLEELT